MRGEFRIDTPNGTRAFAVAEGTLFEIFANGTSNSLGAVGNDGFLVSFAGSAQQLLLASAGTAYVYDLNANTLTAIGGATFSGAVSLVGYCDGFFLALIASSNTFYVSAPLDATDWTTNGASLVSVFPDNLLGMLVDHREVWFWSATRAVVYYDSGNVFPFDVVPGGFIEQGLAARFSPAQLDNTIFWLGADSRGSAVVWRAQGYTPSRVSNHAIEYAMQGYARIDDAIGFSFQMDGHYFYQLYFPTANATWRFDVATNMWHEVGYWNLATGTFIAHKSQVHVFVFGKHLVGDWGSDTIYQMAIPVYSNGVWLFADDDGNPIRRVRRIPHLSKDQKKQAHHQLQLYLESGLGPMPPLPSTEAPTTLYLADPTGVVWALGVTDAGDLTTTAISTPIANSLTATVSGANMNYTLNYNSLSASFTIPVNPTPTGFAVGVLFWLDASPIIINGVPTTTRLLFGNAAFNGGVEAYPAGFFITGTQLFSGTEQFPTMLAGVFTFAPGQLQISPIPAPVPSTIPAGNIFINDTTGTTSWQVQIDAAGILSAIPTGLGSYPQSYTLSSGKARWILQVDNVGVLQTNFKENVSRAPQINLRWSDDGAHSFSNEYSQSMGKGGEFAKRVMWRRLGFPRDRVYEFSGSDPVPYRLNSAFLEVGA